MALPFAWLYNVHCTCTCILVCLSGHWDGFPRFGTGCRRPSELSWSMFTIYTYSVWKKNNNNAGYMLTNQPSSKNSHATFTIVFFSHVCILWVLTDVRFVNSCTLPVRSRWFATSVYGYHQEYIIRKKGECPAPYTVDFTCVWTCVNTCVSAWGVRKDCGHHAKVL